MSSCNNSQAIQIKNDLGLNTDKNDEFSFNGGGAPFELEKSEPQSVLIKTHLGQTIRISPAKKNQEIQLKPEVSE